MKKFLELISTIFEKLQLNKVYLMFNEVVSYWYVLRKNL